MEHADRGTENPGGTAPAILNLTVIDDSALQAFDAAIAPFTPTEELLSVAPGRGLTDAMAALVHSMRLLNVDEVNRKFNWYQRFTGLNLEARIKFDIATEQLSHQMEELVVAAERTRRTVRMLQADLPRLHQARASNEALVDLAYAALRDRDGNDFHVARLMRKVANLEAICASNKLAEAQFKLSIDALSSQIDRFGEIEKMLFPMWQQHAFAIAQSQSMGSENSSLILKFSQTHDQITRQLVAGETSERTSS